MTGLPEDRVQLAVLVGAALVIGGLALAPHLAPESEALHLTSTYKANATMTTANCSVDTVDDHPNNRGGGCQRAADLNTSQGEWNQAAGANDDPSIRAKIWLNQSSGLLTVEGYGSGFEPGYSANVSANATINGTDVVGAATDAQFGGQFQGAYVSLIYFNPDDTICSRNVPGGYFTPDDRDSDFSSMFVGYWDVNDDGTATIDFTKTAPAGRLDPDDPTQHDGLKDYNTVSVRRMGHNTTAFAGTAIDRGANFDPAPATFNLKACGTLQDNNDV